MTDDYVVDDYNYYDNGCMIVFNILYLYIIFYLMGILCDMMWMRIMTIPLIVCNTIMSLVIVIRTYMYVYL